MDSDKLAGDGFAPDSVIAKDLHKHPKTLPRWDNNPKMKDLGWPAPVYFNGRRHRPLPEYRAFLRNAAAAHLTTNPFKS